jgi:hypothetical protein
VEWYKFVCLITVWWVKKWPSRGRPRIRCVCADLRAMGISVEDWEAECQFRCAWRKRFWEFLTQEQSSSSRICMSQGEGVCKQQHSMQITTPCPSLVEQHPLLEPSPNPTRLWLNLNQCIISTCVLVWVSGLHLSKYIALLFCTPLHLATTRVYWCICLSITYESRYTPSGRMAGCVALLRIGRGSGATWYWVRVSWLANMAG